MSTYSKYPANNTQNIPTVATAANLPALGAYDGQVYLTLDTDSLYAWNSGSGMWVLLNSASTVTGVGTTGKVTVWTGTSSLGVSAGSGISYLTSGALNTIADGTANKVLGMNAAANGYEYKSVLGTSNQVTVTHGVGTITLSLPQDIATASSPTFAGLTLSDFSVAGIVHNNASGVLSSSLIVNADVSASAAIAYSKLDLTNSIVNADVSASAAIAYSKLALTNSIVNADISNSAAIAYSKLSLTGSIVNADVNASAAIAYSKLNLSGSIVNADVSASAAIAYSKLALTNSIVNADISNSAAIAYSKLSLTGSIVNADVSASAAIAASKLAGVLYSTKTHADSGATLAEGFYLWTLTNTNDDTATVPAASSNAGRTIRIKLANTTAAANVLTLSRTGSDTFTLQDGTAGATSLVLFTAGEEYALLSDGTSVWQVIQHSSTTCLTAFSMVITGSSSNPTRGNVGAETAFYKRDGDEIEVYYYLNMNSAGLAGSGAYLFSLPLNLSLISGINPNAANPSAIVGTAVLSSQADGTSAHSVSGTVFMYSASKMGISFQNRASVNLVDNLKILGSGTDFDFSVNSNLQIAITARIPVGAWKA